VWVFVEVAVLQERHCSAVAGDLGDVVLDSADDPVGCKKDHLVHAHRDDERLLRKAESSHQR
jgi:hypothetical protein